MDTWSEREAGLGYIEVEAFLFNFFLFLFSIGSMSVSFGLSYEYLLGLGLGSFYRARMKCPLAPHDEEKENHSLDVIVYLCVCCL